jgi:hypothetical protein
LLPVIQAEDMGSSHVPGDLPETLAANREELRRRSRAERVRPLWLWIGILTGPVAFLVVRTAGILLLSHACHGASTRVLDQSPEAATAVITILGAVATSTAGFMSWRIWRRTSLRADEVSSGTMPRVPFWALGGVLLSAFFLFAIAITGGISLALDTGCP